MQAVGALRSDVAADRVDVLISGAHNWLLGPHSVGFAHLSDRVLDTPQALRGGLGERGRTLRLPP
jgi:selenocysteine lyase/cysteine desulfurase